MPVKTNFVYPHVLAKTSGWGRLYSHRGGLCRCSYCTPDLGVQLFLGVSPLTTARKTADPCWPAAGHCLCRVLRRRWNKCSTGPTTPSL